MSVTVESSGNLIIAYLIGELDHHTSAETREKIDNVISYKKPQHLILDFKNVTFMDSSGIGLVMGDRKSTRLNSSHANISYAVFCLKKQKYG